MSLWRKWHSVIGILTNAGVLVSVVGNISMKRRLTQPVPHVKGPQRRMGIFYIIVIISQTHTHTIHWFSYGVWCLTIPLFILRQNGTHLHTMKYIYITDQSWGPRSKYCRNAEWLSLACFRSCSLLRRVSPVSIIIIAKMASSSTANRAR